LVLEFLIDFYPKKWYYINKRSDLMKFCLNSRQSNEYLKKADEIRFEFGDREVIPDYAEKYPKATLILNLDLYEEADWKELSNYNILAKNKLILCIQDIMDAELAKNNEIKFYFDYPVTTFYELNSMKNLGVSYVKIGIPLFFQMDKVKNIGVPIRVTPNVAYSDGFPREDGVCGQWIRPENMDDYDEYIDVIDFEQCNLRQEQAMFRIYAEQKEWPGELGTIITNLNYPGVNRLIPPDATKRRLNCGQRCQYGPCKLCYHLLDLADPEKLKAYLKESEK
jgi:hypothetical protein